MGIIDCIGESGYLGNERIPLICMMRGKCWIGIGLAEQICGKSVPRCWGGELEFDSTRLGGTTTIIQLMITLHILACVGFQIDIGDMFDVTKTTVGRPFHRKVGILAGRLQSRVCPTAGDIVRKQNFQPTNFSRICPIHFSPSAFSMDPECGDTKLTLR